MSFHCEHCHFQNTEVQPAGEIQQRGTRYVFNLDRLLDLDRQIVKSDAAVVRIENLDIEVPAGRGKLTNIEGIVSEICNNIQKDQEQRKRDDVNIYEKLQSIVLSLEKMLNGISFPFTISLDDPTGNSWIEPLPDDSSRKHIRSEYDRTPRQNEALGLVHDVALAESTAIGLSGSATDKHGGGAMEGVDIVDDEVYTLPCECPGCGKNATCSIQSVKIPYFQQVFISTVVCMGCGYRTNDVKTGGEIPSKGRRIWLDIKTPEDLSRDILKSETCCLKVPACNVEVQPGTMGGRFTTVEGLLTQVRDDLRHSIFDIDDVDGSGGDSMQAEKKQAWIDFFSSLDRAIQGKMEFTILLEDPLASSYIQSFTSPSPDPQIKIEDYVRSQEEEEDLGLTDMRTKLNSDGDYDREDVD